VKIIVSDNDSSDDTLLKVNELTNKYNFITVKKNSVNLGLIGNLESLIEYVKSEYIWFLSDDDKIEKGAINNIVTAINKYGPEYLFLNYYNNGAEGYTGPKGLIKNNNSKYVSLKIFEESYGALVFISACVYKKNNLVELSNIPMSKWLGAPMLYSFFSCAKGDIYICEKPLVNFRNGNASYGGIKRESKLKFEEYISILELLPQLGYDHRDVNNAIKKFFQKQSHAYLIYTFFSPRNALRLYRRYSTFKILLTIPFNIIMYLKRRVCANSF